MTPSSRADGSSPSRWGAFALLLLAAAAVFSPVLVRIVAISLREPQYSHLPLIPLVTVYLFWIDREKIFSTVRPAPLAGAATTLAGLALSSMGLLLAESLGDDDSLSMLTVGLLVVVTGLFLGCFGPVSTRKAAFPLGFMLFMVPIPSFLLDVAVTFLQRASAEATYGLFKLVGVPVYRQGFLFSIPRLTVEVARECSGIRSSIALTITAVLAGRLFFDGWRSRVFLVLFVIPLTVFKNAIRIVGLCLLSIYVNDGFMRGSLHRDGGIAFFLLALLLASPIFFWLRRVERSHRN